MRLKTGSARATDAVEAASAAASAAVNENLFMINPLGKSDTGAF
jgi:hypothetical protein